MAKVVPHDIFYRRVKSIGTTGDWILYVGTLISLIILAVDNNWIAIKIEKDEIMVLLNSILSIASIAYFILDLIQNFLFQKAESIRRKDFIDNSLATQLSDENSVGYYSNDNVSYGILKMGANCFENSFYTKEITNRMKLPMVIKTGIVVVLFLTAIFFTSHKILSAISQLALPFTIVQQMVRLFFYNARVAKVFEEFKIVFSGTKPIPTDLLIYPVLEYEATLGWGGILPNSNIFNKLTPELKRKWESIKTTSGI